MSDEKSTNIALNNSNMYSCSDKYALGGRLNSIFSYQAEVKNLIQTLKLFFFNTISCSLYVLSVCGSININILLLVNLKYLALFGLLIQFDAQKHVRDGNVTSEDYAFY